MKNKKFNSGLIALIIILLLVFGFIIFSIFNPISTINVSLNSSKSDKKINGKNKKYVATVYIEGTIEESNYTYNQEWILSTIQKLTNDEKNVGLALFINSPGGGVYQSDEVYLALQNYKTTGKKIYVYMGSLAASGGYYIACAGNTIYANRNTLTGSIGVIAGQSFDLTQLFENLGIKSETIHAGKNKNMGNYNEPFTDEQRAILQSVADECYEQFVSIVSTQRNIPYDSVCTLADGRIYTAKQALDAGLIDKIDSWDNFISDIKNDFEDNADLFFKDFKFEKKQTFFEMMLQGVANIAETQVSAKLGLPKTVIDDMNDFSSYPAYIAK